MKVQELVFSFILTEVLEKQFQDTKGLRAFWRTKSKSPGISGRRALKIGCSYVSIAAKQEPTTVQLQDGNK